MPHAESYRIWEAIESGSVPVIEQDGYFDQLLGADHPIPSLPVSSGCPRRNTASRSDVEREGNSMGENVEIGGSGSRAEPETGGGDDEETKRLAGCVAATWETFPDLLVRLEEAEEGWEGLAAQLGEWWRDFKDNVASKAAALVRGSEMEGGGSRCLHYDLRCIAREEAETGAPWFDPLLSSSIETAKRRAGTLLPTLPPRRVVEASGPPQAEGGVRRGGVVQAGSFPNGACSSSCDCVGHLGCVDGVCSGSAREGECGDGGGVHALFDNVLVVTMNRTRAKDRLRWQRMEAQLRKYGLAPFKFPAVDGSKLNSSDIQELLNDGVISPDHDSLIMEEVSIPKWTNASINVG
jgi:hypothetical protein